MSFVDCRSLPPDHRVTADLCIIGSGAAGLSLANEFLGSSLRVAILESGGFDLDPQTQDLNRGSNVGLPYYDLGSTRLRYFGGTTNHWSAHVRPFERIDFEERSWVPHSGWPLAVNDLERYYDQACQFLGLGDTAFDVAAWQDAGRPWPFEHGNVQAAVVQIATEEKRRFAPRLRKKIEASENLTVYLHANVLEVETDPNLKRIVGLRFAPEPARHLIAEATYYVMAAGALENARLLLASSRISPGGVGNRHDLVGRFFGNHLEVHTGITFHPSSSTLESGFYRIRAHDAGQVFGAARLSDEMQRRHRLLNARIHFRGPTVPEEGAGTMLESKVAGVIFDMDHLGQAGDGSASACTPTQEFFPLSIIAEHAPNSESRVTLSGEVDRFGQPRVVLDWRMTDLDSASIINTVSMLARQVGASRLGRIRSLLPDEDLRSINLKGSYHHTGTTRMSDSPETGVVDRNCRVHGLSNLFVASSSVFPTHGTANPTLTIIALAFRLAAHLKGLLQ